MELSVFPARSDHEVQYYYKIFIKIFIKIVFNSLLFIFLSTCIGLPGNQGPEGVRGEAGTPGFGLPGERGDDGIPG